ncbi:hypothetical protein EVAR_47321_1 [Eumeta japonica]|uniref:Uncharacterized protein n=1 Tax=Eumeta variegata TaxID=151549 RepID=A0A4C1YJX2_EUMVA|nr:hypothetical protein EVAR_47321_1 [Eumeta japonica]
MLRSADGDSNACTWLQLMKAGFAVTIPKPKDSLLGGCFLSRSCLLKYNEVAATERLENVSGGIIISLLERNRRGLARFCNCAGGVRRRTPWRPVHATDPWDPEMLIEIPRPALQRDLKPPVPDVVIARLVTAVGTPANVHQLGVECPTSVIRSWDLITDVRGIVVCAGAEEKEVENSLMNLLLLTAARTRPQLSPLADMGETFTAL